jgi:hypothetical protein
VRCLATAALSVAFALLFSFQQSLADGSATAGVETASISPHAQRIAIVKNENSQRKLVVVNLVDKNNSFGMNLDAKRIISILWINDDLMTIVTRQKTIAVGVAGPSSDWDMAELIDTRTHHATPVQFHVNGFRTGSMVQQPPSLRMVKGEPMLYFHGYIVSDTYVSQQGVTAGTHGMLKPALLAFNPKTNHTAILDRSESDVATWLIDEGGVVVFRQEYFKTTRTWSQKVITRGLQHSPITGIADYADIPRPRGISGDGKKVIILFTLGSKVGLKAVALDSGESSDLTDTPDLGARELFDRLSSRMVRFATPGYEEPHFSDPSRQEIWNAIVSSHVGYVVSDISYSDDFKKHIITKKGERSTFYELYDSELGTTLNIGVSADNVALN